MRISSNTILRLTTVAFVLVLAGAGNTFAAGSLVTKYERPEISAPQEQVKKFKGVVVKRDPDAFTMSETTGGSTTTVILTADTEVKSHKRGAFRGSKEYASSYILRGLESNHDGQVHPALRDLESGIASVVDGLERVIQHCSNAARTDA